MPWLSEKVDSSEGEWFTEARVELVGKGELVVRKEIFLHARIEMSDGAGGFAGSNPIPVTLSPSVVAANAYCS